MAGAVPQSRGGSNTSTLVMVISIVVAALLLGVLIWLITMQEQLRSTAEKATSDRARVQKNADDLNKSLQDLCRALSGSEKDAPATSRKKFEDALAKLAADDKLVNKEQVTPALGAAAVIDNLQALYVDERNSREIAESERDKAVKDLKAATDQMTKMQDRFGSELASLKSKVDELQLAKAEFEKLKSADLEVLQSQVSAKQLALESMRRQATELNNHLKDEISRRERLLEEQKNALSSLRGPPAVGAQELASARQPVATVLRALPGDSLVHLDMGRDQNVTLGMTFTIYSADERVPIDGRGKAAVEVVSLGQRTAECRVTVRPPPDDPIVEGDRAGNIILSREKGRKPRFCVVGDFDIDFDGTMDPQGSAAVTALIERWGGTVVDRVDSTTDYVVMGAEPAAPVVEPARLTEPQAAAETSETADSAESSGEEVVAGEESSVSAEKSEEAGTTSTEEPGDEPKALPSALPKLPRESEQDLTAPPRQRRAVNERARFEEAVHRAEKLAIPRLPADRFYNFVGLETDTAAARALEK